ncbi:MAG: M20/M25/M40 family metallo-hydrolase [Arenimonas sp.]|nr:M20/M25/M40 family metallo-hydrolase [Arenimonas sp.]
MNRLNILSCAICSFLVFSSVSVAKETQNPIEAAIVTHVKSDHQRAMTLLKEAVDINSGTMNFAGVRQVGAVFEREFKDLGFSTQWIDGTPFNRAGHLVAEHGNQGPKILLIGHLDTVFAEDSPFQKMQVISPDKASGPGTTDMKGGDVIIIHALRALRDSGQLNNMRIRVVMTGDEENSGEPSALSKQALLEAGEWADIALGFEDGDGDPKTAAISRRGASGWQLEVKGKPAHSSQIFQPEVGDGAIFEAARILDGFRVALSKEPNLSFNPGVIVGGTDITLDEETSRGSAFGKGNVIAQTVRVSGDLRAISPEQLISARQTMDKIVAAHLPHTSAKIIYDDGYPPMAPTEGNKKLLAIYSGVSEDYGFGPVVAINPRKAGAADISFVASKVDMALDGIGMMGSGGHTVDEVADIGTLDSQTIRAAITLYRLSLPHK